MKSFFKHFFERHFQSQMAFCQPQATKSIKEIQKEELQNEEKEFMNDQKRRLLKPSKLIDEINESLFKEEKKQRTHLKEEYDKLAKIQKYKKKLSKRTNQRTISGVIQETGAYSATFLFMNTNDPVLYGYKRKLKQHIQWELLKNQGPPILLGSILYGITRLLKSRSSSDGMYFLGGYLLGFYGLYITRQHQLYELGYPAHPYIQEKRSEMINNICYYYPGVLKNEIEFLAKNTLKPLSEKVNASEDDLQEFELNGAKVTAFRYERDFLSDKKFKFKIIVQDGQLYLKCIDSFEDIFQLSKDIVQEMELTDILDPYIFDSHKDVINALFEVYYDLATLYIKYQYFGKDQIQEKAKNKIKQKYGLDDSLEAQSGVNEAKELLKSFRQ